MRVLISVLLLSSLSILGQATWNRIFTQTLDSDLDEQLCPSELHRGTIIDIHESMGRGAELMDGLTKGSVQECMAGCCATRGCDLALFKNEGLSKTGKNCYYVRCGGMENCVLVEHSAFTSVIFKPRTINSLRTSTTASPAPAPSQALPTSSSPVPTPTTTPPTPVTTETVTTQETDDITTTVSTVTNTTTEVKNSTAVKKLDAKGKVVADKGSVVVAPSVSGDGKAGSKTGESDPCGEYGCDGSGVVAVVVVAVICFAIVLVVVAIMVKKAVDKRRKRKFRNVDYLINGMYT